MDQTYSYKDVDMLLASQTIAANFTAHKTAITAVRSSWADPFISNFSTSVDAAIQKYLGLDPETQNFFAVPPLKTIIIGIQITL